jgi:hypothetical protein
MISPRSDGPDAGGRARQVGVAGHAACALVLVDGRDVGDIAFKKILFGQTASRAPAA